MSNVNLVEFKLSRVELDEYYKKASILLNPTRHDSFSLVTLEAMKYGCAIIATDMYAIKEMVLENYNGYITKPKYPLWDEDGTFNKYLRTHQKQTICSGDIDDDLVDWMYEKMVYLENNKKELNRLCVNSLKLARETEFSEKLIIKKWKEIFEGCK